MKTNALPVAAVALLAVLSWSAVARAALPVTAMVRLTVDGRAIEGTPLAWNAQVVQLLGRDGWLWELDPSRITDFRTTSNRFSSYSTSELRAILLRSVGDGYDVSGTSHYLVAHPRGQRDRWAERFEDLYRSFVHYFSVRGFAMEEPPFPLLSIVCKDRADFGRFANDGQGPMPAGLVGIYGLLSNRIVLYDMQTDGDPQGWQHSASVIIHEATHQMAFNTGVHSRSAPPPLWVAEGLATLFEARGVYDSYDYAQQADRINRGRLDDFRTAVEPGHRPESIEALVASDRRFQTGPTAAYAEAWALTFFLVETRPREYARYLAMTAGRPPLSDYPAAERVADFQSAFGDDWRMFEARFLRFMAQVK